MAGVDLEAATKRVRGHIVNGRQTLKVQGKNFGVDRHGNFYADIHVNPWIAIPFLTHIIFGKGLAPSGRWVSFRGLRDGIERCPLFYKRCEEFSKRVT